MFDSTLVFFPKNFRYPATYLTCTITAHARRAQSPHMRDVHNHGTCPTCTMTVNVRRAQSRHACQTTSCTRSTGTNTRHTAARSRHMPDVHTITERLLCTINAGLDDQNQLNPQHSVSASASLQAPITCEIFTGITAGSDNLRNLRPHHFRLG